MKSHWLTEGLQSCDPETFRAAVDAWEAAQTVPLRTEPPKGPGYFLADIPINRAALATVKFLRERGVSNPQAYLFRLMHLDEVFANAAQGGQLSRYVKPSDEADAVLVSSVLLDAVALAPIPKPADLRKAGPMLDIDAIDRIAGPLWDAEQSNEVGAG